MSEARRKDCLSCECSVFVDYEDGEQELICLKHCFNVEEDECCAEFEG